MKKFKNNFGVTGTLSLLNALKEEVEKIGWKYDNVFSPWGMHSDLYFNADRKDGCMKTQHFSSTAAFNQPIYNLPEQWDECLKAASELVEENPEYVECIKTLSDATAIKQGKIYKVIMYNPETQKIIIVNEFGKHWGCSSINLVTPNLRNVTAFTFSTKEAYEKQQKELEMKELLEEAKKRYPVGTIFKLVGPESGTTSVSGVPYFNKGEDIIWNHGGLGRIYSRGKWAEIISKPGKEYATCIYTASSEFKLNKKYKVLGIDQRSGRPILQPESGEISSYPLDGGLWRFKLEDASKEEEPIEIAGYTARFEEGKVSIGCYKDITLKDLKTLRRAIKIAQKYTWSFEVTNCSVIQNGEGNAIFLDEIEQLIERLDG